MGDNGGGDRGDDRAIAQAVAADRALLRRLAPTDGDRAAALGRLCQGYERGGRVDAALRTLAVALWWRPELETIAQLNDLVQRHGTDPATSADAIALLERAMAAAGTDASPLWPLAVGYCQAAARCWAQAVAAFEQAIALANGSATTQPLAAAMALPLGVTYGNWGSERYLAGDYDGALPLLLRSARLRPDDRKAAAALFQGAIAGDGGMGGQRAIAGLRVLAKLDPDNADYRWSQTDHLLRNGEFVEGFRQYEWRLKLAQFQQHFLPYPLDTLWQGDALPNGTLLVIQEQGFGDTIQFARYLPAIAPRVQRLVFACAAPLVPLFAASPAITAVAEVVELRQEILFDRYLPLLSIPHHLGRSFSPLGTAVPYLQAGPAALPTGPGIPVRTKIGIVWSTGREAPAGHDTHHQRTCPFEHFARLADRPTVELYSLQVGPDSDEFRSRLGDHPHCHDLSPTIANFADTSAAITAIDLIITVDTAVGHLAGALGKKPIWILLPAEADWRWFRDRTDSPWYPKARLFRQPEPGHWDAVWQAIDHTLDALLTAPPLPGQPEGTDTGLI